MKKPIYYLLISVLIFSIISAFSFAGCKAETPETTAAETTAAETTAEETVTPANPVADLSDIRVRQAIAYAIDMDTIAVGMFEGKATATNSLTPPNDPMRAESLPEYKYDPELARQLLEEANWDYDYVLDVVYYYGDQQTVDLMATIQAYLAGVGIKMSFRKIEGDVAAQLWTPPEDRVNGPSAVDWDLAYGAVAALTLHDYYGRFGSSSNINSHTPAVPELDALIETTQTTTDLEAQADAFKQIQAIVDGEVLAIPLYHQQLFIYESTRLDRGAAEYGNDQYNYDWGIIDWNLEGSTTLQGIGAPVEKFQPCFLNPGLDFTNKILFDRLILADAGLTPSEPMLAESYSLSDDGLTLTLELRDDVKWHDGEAFDAEDVVFTLELLATVPTVPDVAKGAVMAIEGAQAFADGTADSISGISVDGNTVTINFENPSPNILVALSQWSILPEHLLGGADPLEIEKDEFWQSPVGTGPFMVEEVSLNDFATFSRNADYFMEGTGNIETIQLVVGGETEGDLPLSAEAGNIDYAFGKSVTDAKAIEALDNMKVTPVDIRYTRLLYVNKFPQAN